MYFTTVGAENYFDKLIFLFNRSKFPFQRKITLLNNFPFQPRELSFFAKGNLLQQQSKKYNLVDRVGGSILKGRRFESHGSH